MASRSGAKDLVGYSFLVAFANDDTLDADELRMIEKLALADGKIDAEEREILRNLLDRVEDKNVAVEVQNEIDQFREANNI